MKKTRDCWQCGTTCADAKALADHKRTACPVNRSEPKEPLYVWDALFKSAPARTKKVLVNNVRSLRS